jgi:hypothetical protein
MKTYTFLLIIVVFSACTMSEDTNHRDCSKASDAYKYPPSSEWPAGYFLTFSIPDNVVKKMSTCGLLTTYLTHPRRMGGPWDTLTSNSNSHGLSWFINDIEHDNVAMELVKRIDWVDVAFNHYASEIESKKEITGEFRSFEMLLSYYEFVKTLNNDRMYQLLTMTLKLAKQTTDLIETRHIMVSIMKVYDYKPFLEYAEQENGFQEWTRGYLISGSPIVEQYAKEFLQTLKTE